MLLAGEYLRMRMVWTVGIKDTVRMLLKQHYPHKYRQSKPPALAADLVVISRDYGELRA